jgi:hypothetical protein
MRRRRTSADASAACGPGALGRALSTILAFGLLASVGVGAPDQARAQGHAAPANPARAPAERPKSEWMAVGGDPIERVLKQVRTFADCVRRHGIPDLPQPKLVGETVFLTLPRGLDRDTPRVKKAQRTCEKVSPQPPGSHLSRSGKSGSSLTVHPVRPGSRTSR